MQAQRDHQLADQAQYCLPTLVELLTQQFQATQIILFGSLAKGTLHQGSDIDLAVAGIAPERYFAAVSTVNGQGYPFAVDLKPVEALDPHFYQRVIETGECLYGINTCQAFAGDQY